MSKPLRVLFVEDSEEDTLLQLRELRHGGYDPSYKRVETSEAMRAALDKEPWDIIISDHRMPRFSAPKALALLKRKRLDLPFIIVSGQIGEELAVSLMKAGAHDYISKDSLARLVPAIQRELREAVVRREHKQAEEELKTGFEKLQGVLEGIVNVLGTVVEIKDPYTAGHEKCVKKLACAIAREMGFSKDRVEGISIAGRLHDIGKISVPMSTLGKPIQLDETEFSLIKSHPEVGYKILQNIGFRWPIAQVTLQHHERMDGSGYPNGLAGKKILLEARILAVADVVSAMASRRPWRPAHSMDSILEELTQNRGILYDPQVVDSCIKLFVKKGFKFGE